MANDKDACEEQTSENLTAASLRSVSIELRSLADATEHIQTTIGSALTQISQLDNVWATSIQDIDRVTQSLHAIADFVKALSILDDPQTTDEIDIAIANLPLRDLASRLRSEKETKITNNNQSTAGQIEIF